MVLTDMVTMGKSTIKMQTITEAAMVTLATIPVRENTIITTEATVT